METSVTTSGILPDNRNLLYVAVKLPWKLVVRGADVVPGAIKSNQSSTVLYVAPPSDDNPNSMLTDLLELFCRV